MSSAPGASFPHSACEQQDDYPLFKAGNQLLQCLQLNFTAHGNLFLLVYIPKVNIDKLSIFRYLVFTMHDAVSQVLHQATAYIAGCVREKYFVKFCLFLVHVICICYIIFDNFIFDEKLF